MTKRLRYFLIACCFVIFFGMAPVLVFFVRGISYDTTSNTYLYTGILAIKTSPRGAAVLLNGKEVDTTPVNIRFLKPDEYAVTIQKPGYQPWAKRLTIETGKVTWANVDSDQLYLVLNEPKITNIASGVKDFYKLDTGWLYLTDTSLVEATNDTGTATLNISLPKSANSITESPNGKIFLLTGNKTYLQFNLDKRSVVDVSKTLADTASAAPENNGNILALTKSGQLEEINTSTQKATVIQQDVYAFTMQAGSVYFLQKTAQGGELFVLQASNLAAPAQLLTTSVPVGESELLVTEQKEIFALIDHSLYRINESAQSLAENVSAWHYDTSDDSLIFTTASEMDYYDSLTHTVKLISRSSSGFSNPILRSLLGLAFYLQNGKLSAIELDTRSNQNTYPLDQAESGSKFEVDSNAKNIYLLTAGKLESLQIR